MKVIVFCALAISFVCCLPTDYYRTEWENFKTKFHKSYNSDEEEAHRFDIFSVNLDRILDHNDKYENGKMSYKMAVTNFTDLTGAEFVKFLEEEAGHHPFQVGKSLYEDEFESFKLKFHKTYPTAEEESYRFQIFCKTLDEVVAHNKLYEAGQSSFEMGINQFADLTTEERHKYLLGGVLQYVPLLPEEVYQEEWKNFKATYNKLYDSEDEESMRYDIFCENLNKITIHNKLYDLGLSTSKMGINKFADYTPEEYDKMMGLKPHH